MNMTEASIGSPLPHLEMVRLSVGKQVGDSLMNRGRVDAMEAAWYPYAVMQDNASAARLLITAEKLGELGKKAAARANAAFDGLDFPRTYVDHPKSHDHIVSAAAVAANEYHDLGRAQFSKYYPDQEYTGTLLVPHIQLIVAAGSEDIKPKDREPRDFTKIPFHHDYVDLRIREVQTILGAGDDENTTNDELEDNLQARFENTTSFPGIKLITVYDIAKDHVELRLKKTNANEN